MPGCGQSGGRCATFSGRWEMRNWSWWSERPLPAIRSRFALRDHISRSRRSGSAATQHPEHDHARLRHANLSLLQEVYCPKHDTNAQGKLPPIGSLLIGDCCFPTSIRTKSLRVSALHALPDGMAGRDVSMRDRDMTKGRTVHQLRPTSSNEHGRSVQDTMTALIREAHKQQQQPFRDELGPIAKRRQTVRFADGGSPMLPEALRSLLNEIQPNRRLSDLVLAKQTMADIRDLIAEIRDTQLLRSHSLEPRHTLMLVGPPGTGKTSLASALAAELALPFLTVRYDGLVGSFLGETASRLQEVIDYASRTPCVLFFDEFDSVGKERSDAHETGEIKRVVSSLLLHMDALPTHCVVICATNHPELLDRAVWRRFELRIELPRPGATEIRDWFNRTEKSFGKLGVSSQEFVAMFSGETFSEIEAVTIDARRKVVLSRGILAPSDAFREAVERWERRRSIGNFAADGSTSNSKNPSRARTPNKKKRLTPDDSAQADFLRGSGEKPQQ